MGLLTSTDRRTLISLLLKLPNISDQGVRRTLLAGLPGGLVQSISFSNAPFADLNAILDVVDGESWAQLPDDSWSVVAVLDNAIMLVGGSRLEQDLRTFKDALLARATPPAAPPAPVVAPVGVAPPATRAGGSGDPVPGRLVKLTGKQAEELQKALLSAFQDIDELQQMVRFGLDTRLNLITGSSQLRTATFELIEWAMAQGRLEELIVVARDRVPRNPDLRAFAEKYLTGPSIVQKPDAPESIQIAIERIVNKAANFSNVDSWLSRMSEVINTICRVETPKPNGTGFLVGKDLVITNHHVVDELLASPSKLSRVLLRFDYRADAAGVEVRKGETYKLAANPVVFDSPFEELDFVLLRVDGAPGEEPIGGQSGAPARSWLTPIAQPLVEHQPLFVVQHPDAQPLKIAFGSVLPANLPGGLKTPARRVRYDIPTLGGSSGAPCFNDQWELVALHHGGENRDPARFNEGIPFSDILAVSAVRQALGV